MQPKQWKVAALLAVALGAGLTVATLVSIGTAWRAGYVALAGPPAGTAPRADVAIVLGAMAWGEEPSPALAERLEPAAALYNAGRVGHIILTGGVDTGGTISEAEAGARYLGRRYGIPRSALGLDETSTSTFANLKNAQAIMKENGWRTALVVTHSYHLRRAALLAQDLGLAGGAIGTESRVLILPPLVAREVAALFVYWGWNHWLNRG